MTTYGEATFFIVEESRENMSARGVNKVILVGNIGNDPETFVTKSGDKIVSISVATSETWGEGEAKQTRTEWHKIKIFKKLAEIAEKYLRKGSKIYLEGALRTTKWEKDGVDRYTTEIICSSFQMLDSKPQGDAASSSKEYAKAKGKSANELSTDFDEEIPF